MSRLLSFSYQGICLGISQNSSRKSRFNETSGPGWKWWQGFCRRHPEISLCQPDNLDCGQSHMNSQTVMNNFLDETG